MSQSIHGYNPVTDETTAKTDSWRTHRIEIPPTLDARPLLWTEAGEDGAREWISNPLETWGAQIHERREGNKTSYFVKAGINSPVGVTSTQDTLDDAFKYAHVWWRHEAFRHVMPLKPTVNAQGIKLSKVSDGYGPPPEYILHFTVNVRDREGSMISSESRESFQNAGELFKIHKHHAPIGFRVEMIHGDRKVYDVLIEKT